MRMHNVDVKSSVWISWIIIHEILENAKVTFADVHMHCILSTPATAIAKIK